RRDVLSIYYDDYARKWDELLADLTIKPFANVREGLDVLAAIVSPASPLRELFTEIDRHTQLSRAAASDGVVAAARARAARVGQRAAGFAAFEARSGLSWKQVELTNILGEAIGSDTVGKPVDPARRVDEHFKTLHDFVWAPEGRPVPLDL